MRSIASSLWNVKIFRWNLTWLFFHDQMQDGMCNAEEHKDRIQVYRIETSVNANTFIFMQM